MDELKEFLNHDDEIVRNAAQEASFLKSARDSGDVTEEQYQELGEDLLEATTLRKLTETLERKIIILQAFTTMRTILGVLTA